VVEALSKDDLYRLPTVNKLVRHEAASNFAEVRREVRDMEKRAIAFDMVWVYSAIQSQISFWRSVYVASLALAIGVAGISYTYGSNGAVSPTAKEQLASQMTEPGYLEVMNDPMLGTKFSRVTTPGRELMAGVLCNPKYCRHRYSSAQAWNADESLLVITAGCPGFCFLDGQDYKPLFSRPTSQTECEWHPTDPALMICVADREIYSWEVRGDTKKPIYLPQSYTSLRFGPSKGNLSLDGKKLTVRAVDLSGEEIVFAYDISKGIKYPDIRLSELKGANSYCTISPTGQYIFCYQSNSEEINTAYVLTLEGERVQYWVEDHRPGHGDLTIDQDGRDIYVGISKSQPDKFHVIKRRLEDGTITSLLTRSSAQHVSARNTKKPGWVFVTFGTAPPKKARAEGSVPYIQEIAALKIDGGGELRRIVHTRSAKYDYRSEAHASPSPDGSKVIWASNWGHAGGPVSSYVASIGWEP
jgi:hypothetical protein